MFISSDSHHKKMFLESLNIPLRIQMGWLNFNNKAAYTQVWSPNGGGTVYISVARDATYEQVLQKGKDIFFPKGKSSYCRVGQFESYLANFQGHAIDEEDFELDRLTQAGEKFRIYLCSKKAI